MEKWKNIKPLQVADSLRKISEKENWRKFQTSLEASSEGFGKSLANLDHNRIALYNTLLE